MSSIDLIKEANRKETRRVKVDIPIGENTVTFYIAAKDTYAIWTEQRIAYWGEVKRMSKDIEDKKDAQAVALNVNSSALLREIVPKYFKNEDGSPAYKNKEELQEIVDFISSDGDALNAVSEAWVKLTMLVTKRAEEAKNS